MYVLETTFLEKRAVEASNFCKKHSVTRVSDLVFMLVLFFFPDYLMNALFKLIETSRA